MFRSYETGPGRLRHHPRQLHPVPGPAGRAELLHVRPRTRCTRSTSTTTATRSRRHHLPVPVQEHLEDDRAHGRRQAGEDPADRQRPDQRRQPGDAERARDLHASSMVRGDRRSGTRTRRDQRQRAARPSFDKPVDNIGDKTFGSPAAMQTYAGQHIYNVTIPGCGDAGQACSSASARSRSTSPSARSST